MRALRRGKALRAAVAEWRAAGQTVAVVPTMGALHEGHLSLVRAALAQADRVIVTLFVNPRQFNRADDLAAYPKTEKSDAAMLAPLGVDVLFAPPVEEIYPPGFATRITVSRLSESLCGTGRPGHFDGVATVVTKLLLLCGADKAFFGEKDWQQLQVIRRLVADLTIPVAVIGCPTERAADGLALSSRNARLSPADRARAPALYRALDAAARALAKGAETGPAIETARQAILAAGIAGVEYLELRGAADLLPLTRADRPARLLVAAELGGVRLIDNVPVRPAKSKTG